MGLRIKTNVEALVAQRRFSDSRRIVSDSLEKMSSGQRINKSADDAAGLAVSEGLRAKVRRLDQAKRNANDGISYLQVAEGGLAEVTNIVVRMRELASQAASDTVGQTERGFLNKEFQQLRQEVHRIVEGTEFNGQKSLRPQNADQINIFVGATNRAVNADGDAPDIDPDNDPDVVSIKLNDLEKLAENLELVAAESEDNQDIGLNTEDGAGAQELGETGTSELFTRIDTVLTGLADYRATIGSLQSRLNSSIANIEISSENLSAAQSQIRDVDYATETARFTQSKILAQAGLSVLTQANQTPELVMALLR